MRRSSRRLLVAALGLAVFAVLVVVLPNVPAVRDALLARVARSVLETTGGELRGRLALVDVLSGRLALGELSYGVPGEAPFFTARRAALKVAPLSLLERTVRVVSLEAEGVRIDLSLPRPVSKAPPSARPLELPLSVGRFELRDLAVLHPAARLTGAELDGVYLESRARLALKRATLTVPVAGRERVIEVAAARIATEPEGTVSVEGGTLRTSGLEATLSLAAGLRDDSPLRARAELRASLGELAPELRATGQLTASLELSGTVKEPAVEAALQGEALEREGVVLAGLTATLGATRAAVEVRSLSARPAEGGELTATGRYDLTARAGTGTLELAEVPTSVLRPFADQRTLALLRAPGSTLSGRVTASHPSGDANGRLELAEGGRPLGHVTLDGAIAGDGRIQATVEGELLPASPGRRTFAATLEAPAAARVLEGRLVRSRVDLQVPDIPAALAELQALWPLLVPAGVPGAVPATGSLSATARLAGRLRAPSGDLEAEWRPDAEGVVRVSAQGAPLARRGKARVEMSRVSIAPFREDLGGRVTGSLTADGNPTAFSAAATLRASGLTSKGEPVASGDVVAALDARVEGSTLSLGRLEARDDRRSAEVSGTLDWRAPWQSANLDAVATGWSEGLSEVRARITAAGGVLALDVPELSGYGTAGSLSVRAPAGALRPWLTFLPAELPSGKVSVTAELPRLDSRDVREALGEPRGEESAVGAVRLDAQVDPASPARSSGELVVTGLTLESRHASARSPEPIRLTLADGAVRLAEARLVGDGTEVTLSASAELGETRAEPVKRFTLETRGGLEASLLNTFLRGGIASGRLAVEASLTGTPKAPSGTLTLEGPEAAFFWPSPYASRLQAPRLRAELAGGAVTLREATALLNGGRVTLGGGRDAAGNVELTAALAGVRYVLAYGVRAELGGNLRVSAPAEGARVLSGALTFDRGLLDRDVDLDREILTRFFAPPESEGSEASVLDTIRADLTVTTSTGLRVTNNLADLRATWSALEVTGTLREPVIRGRVDVERGGLLFAYGQVFRLDSATLTYLGDPTTDPKIEATTTSSLQDPSIRRPEGAGGALAEAAAESGWGERQGQGMGEALATGLAGYYGERVAQRLSEAVGFARVSLRPILIFGETDPGSRLTVGRDLSRHVAFAFSLDLTNAQEQTYLLDVHGFRRLPTFTAQVFTNDEGKRGATLQQSLRLGGARRRDDAPLLQRVEVTVPEGISRRRLLGALGLEKGDPAPPSTAFDAEVDAERFLRAQGYPDARVSASLAPSARKGRVDLSLAIVPGTKTRFVLEGDRPPGSTRASITSLYRGDFYQAEALEEMRRRTQRVFRAMGHLDPAVGIAVTPPQAPGEARTVTIRTDAGPRVALEAPVFAGLGEDEARLLAARFAGPVERAELAAGSPDADRRVEASLSALGHPAARVVSRTLDGSRLTVVVEPGPRSLVSSVEVAGLSGEDAARLRGQVPLAPGEPARSDLVARGTLAITRDLEARGFADARVRAEVSPASPAPVPPLQVRYVVDPGRTYRVASVRFEGLRSASRSFLTRVAGLRVGEPYRREEADEARGRLFDVGLFSAVREETVKGEGGADVVFRVEEKPRFSVAWGVRYENAPSSPRSPRDLTSGASAVVDVVDHDLFGRAVKLGLRGLYAPRDKGGRLYAGADDLLGSKVRLEMYADVRREDDVDREGSSFRSDTAQATLQLSRPFGRRLSASLYGRYRRSRVRTFIDDPFFPFEIDVTIRYPYLGAQLLYDSRQDPLAGSRGVFASLDVSGSGPVIGSDFSYARVYGQVNLYAPLTRTISWAQSVRAGYARAFAGQALLPGTGAGVRFFAGGEYSVRGYELDSLGPLESTGAIVTAVGGSTLLVLNEELRFPIYSRLSGLVFLDAGNVWEESGDFGSGLSKSLGLGLRATTPVGILRLDAARPLDRREGDPSYKIYLGFGNAF